METRKFKIEQRGGIVTKYYWGKWFLFFGQWIPYHNISFGNNDYANPSAEDSTKAKLKNKR